MADTYSTDADLAALQADQSSWTKEIFSGLVDIGKVAVSNLTGKDTVETAKTTSTSWLSKLDAKQVILLIVAGGAVIFLAKKLFK